MKKKGNSSSPIKVYIAKYTYTCDGVKINVGKGIILAENSNDAEKRLSDDIPITFGPGSKLLRIEKIDESTNQVFHKKLI